MKITVLVLGIYMFTIDCYFQRNVTTCSIDRKAAAFRCLLAKTPNDSLNYKQTIPARDDVFHCSYVSVLEFVSVINLVLPGSHRQEKAEITLILTWKGSCNCLGASYHSRSI